MAFTEFYCDAASGSNLNGGAPIGGVYPLTYASGTWDVDTGIFTPASGNPQEDGVTVGDFASVYPDATTPDTVFVGRVTARDATTITVSLTAKSGTPPIDGTSNTTCKVGGAWKGPNGTSGFPLSFVTNTLVDASANYVRVNLKNTASYSVTAGLTPNNTGPITFQGYSSTAGDAGRATIDGGTTASNLCNPGSGATANTYANLIFTHSVASGSWNLLYHQGAYSRVSNCVFTGARGHGLWLAGSNSVACECEAYDCNKSNTANFGGISSSTVALLVRCISHDNGGSNTSGFYVSSAVVLVNCIADTNGADGIRINSNNVYSIVHHCDCYNNTGDGIDFVATTNVLNIQVESCNLIKNGGYGINASGSGQARSGVIWTCGFGAGTQANSSGTVNSSALPGIVEVGSVTYTADVTPWVDPGDGDFRIDLAAAKGAGRGAFTQTQSGYGDPNSTVAYPDIGAAQHLLLILAAGVHELVKSLGRFVGTG